METIERDVRIDADASDVLDGVSNDIYDIIFKTAEHAAILRSEAGRAVVITKDDVVAASRFLFRALREAIDRGEVDDRVRSVVELMQLSVENREGGSQ